MLHQVRFFAILSIVGFLFATPVFCAEEAETDTGGQEVEMTQGQLAIAIVRSLGLEDEVGFDQTVGQGNTINNIIEVYPEAVVVEYHFEGFDPQYAGMDWRSLRLVFEESGGTWYLVGIVHDEWTI